MRNTAGERQAPLVADGVAAAAVGLAGLSAVLLFLPAEGFLSTPLHGGLVGLLGRSAFVLPPLLALVAALRLVRVRPPVTRLLGLGILVVAVLSLEHLLAPGDGGMAGQWMAEALAAALGGIVTAVVLLCALGAGAWLTFGIRLGQK